MILSKIQEELGEVPRPGRGRAGLSSSGLGGKSTRVVSDVKWTWVLTTLPCHNHTWLAITNRSWTHARQKETEQTLRLHSASFPFLYWPAARRQKKSTSKGVYNKWWVCVDSSWSWSEYTSQHKHVWMPGSGESLLWLKCETLRSNAAKRCFLLGQGLPTWSPW